MPRRHNDHRKTTLSWTSDDEAYNDAAMRTFAELFHKQHDPSSEDVTRACNHIEELFGRGDVEIITFELVRRHIARKMKEGYFLQAAPQPLTTQLGSRPEPG